MTAFIECRERGFVLRGDPDDAEPRHWDSCPDCGSTQFDGVEW